MDYGRFTNVVPVIRAIWDRDLVTEAAVGSLYAITSSADATERTQGLGSFEDVPEFKGTIQFDQSEAEDLKTFTHSEYAKGLSIKRADVDDAKYLLIQRQTQLFTGSFTRTIGKHMASVFNNAFATTGDGAGAADGRALCATGRNSGKAVLNNAGTSPLTHSNVIATRKLMRQFKDSRGNLLAVTPDTLVVPVGLESEAEEICVSVLRSDNANNAVNVNRRLNYIVEPMLDDSNNWFLVDSMLASLHLTWFWRVMPEFVIDPTSDFDLELRNRGYMRYSFGADAAHWIYGHQVED